MSFAKVLCVISLGDSNMEESEVFRVCGDFGHKIGAPITFVEN